MICVGSRGLPRSSPWMLMGGSSGQTRSLRSCRQGERLNLCVFLWYHSIEHPLLPVNSGCINICIKSYLHLVCYFATDSVLCYIYSVNMSRNMKLNITQLTVEAVWKILFHAFDFFVCVVLLQAQNRFCNWSQAAGGPGGAAHPGLDDAHQHLHTGGYSTTTSCSSPPSLLYL